MGVILLVAGVVAFLYFNGIVEEYKTTLGMLGRALSEEMQFNYQRAQIFQMSGVALAIIGIVSLVYGFVRK